MSRLFAWIKRESHAEKLIAEALLAFAQGDTRTALGDLVQGMLEIADGTKAEPALFSLQTRLASFNLIPQPDEPTPDTNAPAPVATTQAPPTTK